MYVEEKKKTPRYVYHAILCIQPDGTMVTVQTSNSIYELKGPLEQYSFKFVFCKIKINYLRHDDITEYIK